MRKLSNSGIFLCAHPYIHLSSHPAVPGASPAKRCWRVSSKPLAHWWTQTCMCQGLALTKAMRVECPCFRIIGRLWDGDKPPQTPGTVPWSRRLVIIGWKGPLGLSHLAIPNPSHVFQICRREGGCWRQDGKIPPEEGGGTFFHL